MISVTGIPAYLDTMGMVIEVIGVFPKGIHFETD